MTQHLWWLFLLYHFFKICNCG